MRQFRPSQCRSRLRGAIQTRGRLVAKSHPRARRSRLACAAMNGGRADLDAASSLAPSTATAAFCQCCFWSASTFV